MGVCTPDLVPGQLLDFDATTRRVRFDHVLPAEAPRRGLDHTRAPRLLSSRVHLLFGVHPLFVLERSTRESQVALLVYGDK